jgi:hypothetical protein
LARAKVAVLKTTPETVLEDYRRLMHLADYGKFVPRERPVALKINISWHYWYPACSTAPWQLEGAIKTLLDDGYGRERIFGAHNRTVVVSAYRGERANKHKHVLDRYGIENVHLYEPREEWMRYEPKGEILVLNEVFPRGLYIPRRLMGCSVIHLPTVKAAGETAPALLPHAVVVPRLGAVPRFLLHGPARPLEGEGGAGDPLGQVVQEILIFRRAGRTPLPCLEPPACQTPLPYPRL